jgi:hypothetical protein
VHAAAGSSLPDHSLFAEETPSQWNAAFRLLAEILPDDTPSVVVIDEVTYLMVKFPRDLGHVVVTPRGPDLAGSAGAFRGV